MDISGQAVLVTGGASGLGQATARAFADAGARVTVIDRDAARGAAFADDINGQFILTDVTSDTSVRDAVKAAAEAHGAARVLVNCAGVGTPARLVDREGTPLDLAAFARVIEVNLIGTVNIIRHFAAALAASPYEGTQEQGVIVNTASVAAYDGQIGQAAYAASKGGIVSLTLPLAREFARAGIRVMTIAPGLFKTPMLEGLPQEAQDSLGKQVPFPNRLGEPSEYAQLARHIIENPMLNGEVIRLDGAIRMAPK